MQTGSKWNFLQLLIQVHRSVYIPYFKVNASFFCCLLLFQEYLKPEVRISKIVNEHNVDYHPERLGLTWRMHPLIAYDLLRAFSVPPEYLLNFILNLYIPQWFGNLFKSMVFRLFGDAFVSQKREFIHFRSSLQRKTFPQVLNIASSQTKGNYYVLFWKLNLSAGGGEETMIELKKWPKLNL